MKTLTTKKLFVAISYNNLKATPPKAFDSVSDMEKSIHILEVLEPAIPDFVENIKESEQLNIDIVTGKVKEDEVKKKQSDFIARSKAIEDTAGLKTISIEFESDDFNTFFQFFEKWGKGWFGSVGDYLGFRRDLNETNQQPKEAKAKGKHK